MSQGFVGSDVLSLLTDDATIAGWNNEGLPSDAMSTENATILTQSIKWPLMIDPQLQVKVCWDIFICFHQYDNRAEIVPIKWHFMIDPNV